MKNSILVLLFVFICSTAHAGYFILHNGETITGKRASCGAVCSNNPNALRVTEKIYSSVTRWHKVVNDVIVGMTQGEIDVILQMESIAKEQAIEDALDRFDVTNLELMTALIQRINARIQNPITKAEIIQQIKDNRD